MTQRPLILQRYDQRREEDVHGLLIEVYAEVYADVLDDPFFSLERFEQRLQSHASSGGWEAVIGYEGEEPVGYAYGSPLSPSTRWWLKAEPPLNDDFVGETGDRTLALFEIMVRRPWRGKGVARLIHDELLRLRSEQRVTLLVEQDHPRVRALYERWGYQRVAEVKPFPDAPGYDLMYRPVRLEAGGQGWSAGRGSAT